MQRKTLLSAFFLLGVVLFAAWLAAARGNDKLQKGSLKIGGVERTYVYFVAESVQGRDGAPLVLVFHGHFGTGAGMARMSQFEQVAAEKGFIVVYPDGIKRSWNDGRGLSSTDDVAFTRALITEFEQRYHVDRKRIYATGISNGGFFSERLACELSDQIAAVAPVAAIMSDALARVCKPSRPVSVLYMQGTKDPLVPINGGPIGRNRGTAMSLEESVRFWRSRNGTQPKGDVTNVPDQAHDGTTARRTVFNGGNDGSEVIEYVFEGGGHTWPNGTQYLPAFVVGPVSHQVDASRVIWEFFARHRLE